MTWTGFRAVATALIGMSILASPALADKIVLRGGGQIKGKVLPDPKRADRVSVLTERGKTPLTFEKAKIVEVIPQPSPLDEYLTRRATTSSSAKPQYELGVWCEENKLFDLAQLHYEASLKADGSFGPAHQKLRHVQHGDRWLTGDEIKEAQGLVKYKGKWVTVGVKDQLEKQQATSAEQASWVRRLKMLREALLSGADDRRREADAQLMSIDEPVAIVPLIKVFGADPPPLRSMLARFLGAIEGPEASAALVSRFLKEEDTDVLHSLLDEIRRREQPEVTKRLLAGLRSDFPDVVNRAAWALANLNAIKTVPNLVGVLVQTKTQVEEPVDAAASGGGGMGVALNPPARSGIGHQGGAQGGPIYGSVTVPGAAAGPGGVAAIAPNIGGYSPDIVPNLAGSSGLPNGMPGLYGAGGSSLSTGGGSATFGNGGRSPQIVIYTIRNAEVLAALIKMTGQDFGYDVDAWKRWLRTSFRPNPTPARRVPQP
jgi:hypothetical protein